MHLKTKTEEKLLSAFLILIEYWIESVFIFLSINSSKRQKKFWKRLVLLLYGNQYCSQKDDVPKTAYVRSIRSSGVGNRTTRGPESCFMFPGLAFKIKVLMILKMIKWNHQLTSKINLFARLELCYYSTGFDIKICLWAPKVIGIFGPLARKILHFVSLTDSFIMLDAKLLKLLSCM